MTSFPVLQPQKFQALPLGSISPRGWLRDQLRIQAAGLTGHLDEFWPSVKDSRWIGGECEGWERGPYWLDGLIPLAFALEDANLKAKSKRWVDAIIETQHEDGWLGAKDDAHEGIGEAVLDPWPLFIVFKAFLQWHSATGDERIVPALLRCARRIGELLDEKPLDSWAQVRWMDLVLSLHTLYELSGEAFLLELAAKAHAQGFNWQQLFADYPHTEKTSTQGLHEGWKLPLHGVNNAMATKGDLIWWRQSDDEADKNASFSMIEQLERYHGQVTGMFSGDEHLAGRSPVQGTETCTIVEYLFSLETMLLISGQTELADRIEKIAFNALPSALDKTMWARQYDGQPNQVWCSQARRDWVSNDANANLYSLEGHFGCCTSNFHQGWPKLAAHLWMKTADGFAATILAPSRLETEFGEQQITIETQTNYPFSEEIRFRFECEEPVMLELQIRVPVWAKGATLEIGGESKPVKAGEFASVFRQWNNGDEIVLRLPMQVRGEHRFNGAVALHYGPLVLALPIEEEWKMLRHHEHEPRARDWEVMPKSAWNYALDLKHSPAKVHTHKISESPFATARPPLEIEVQGRLIPEWKMENDSAAAPPISPVQSSEPLQSLKLIPYGSTTLRISEFPVLEE